ncbi:mobile element protein [Microcystis sp. 0824]|nr:mobile element protein [Microcystis sp. 0824]
MLKKFVGGVNGFSITSHLITQSKLLGGSTPQTPRWGCGAAPKPPAH